MLCSRGGGQKRSPFLLIRMRSNDTAGRSYEQIIGDCETQGSWERTWGPICSGGALEGLPNTRTRGGLTFDGVSAAQGAAVGAALLVVRAVSVMPAAGQAFNGQTEGTRGTGAGLLCNPERREAWSGELCAVQKHPTRKGPGWAGQCRELGSPFVVQVQITTISQGGGEGAASGLLGEQTWCLVGVRTFPEC